MIESKRSTGLIDVSVVIPFYNGSIFLSRIVDTINSQTRAPREVIFIDDGSCELENSLLEVAVGKWSKEASFDLKVYKLSGNQGVSSARNYGWNAACGCLIAFLDCDDAWHCKKIELISEYFLTNRKTVLLGHAVERWHSIGLDVDRTLEVKDVEYLTKRKLIVKNYFVTCSSVVIRRDVKIRFDVDKRRSEDYACWLAICSSGHSVVYLPLVLGYYYKFPYGENGLSKNVWAMEVAELKVFYCMFKKNQLSFWELGFSSLFSSLKFVRRVFLSLLRLLIRSIRITYKK